MLKIPTTAARMVVCVTIPRDLLIALVNLDLLEMDTNVQVQFSFGCIREDKW